MTLVICTEFDDLILQDYDSRGANAFFGLRIKFDETCFPDQKWMDFGGVVLGWWMFQYVRLRNDEVDVSFSFMDGPFRLNLSRSNDDVTFTLPSGEVVGKALMPEIEESLRSAGRRVIDHLSRRNVDEAGCKSLSLGIARMDGSG